MTGGTAGSAGASGPPSESDVAAAQREAVAVLTGVWDPDSTGPRVGLACDLVRTSESDPTLLAASIALLAGQVMEQLEVEGGDGTVAAWLRVLGAAMVLRDPS